jgi:predicted RNase H-like nuclease (RuvC/YqgF family)
MSEPNKDGTDIMMALLMGLSGPRASKAWNESQQIKAESFLTMAEHWINQTAEENARLKAEVDDLRLENQAFQRTVNEASAHYDNRLADISRLKAEVEELKSQPDPLTAYLYADTLRRDDIKTLKAHIERLTKAGDELHAFLINYIVESRISSAYLNKLDDGWNAAKEGKHP